jgi:hypothetical protein
MADNWKLQVAFVLATIGSVVGLLALVYGARILMMPEVWGALSGTDRALLVGYAAFVAVVLVVGVRGVAISQRDPKRAAVCMAAAGVLTWNPSYLWLVLGPPFLAGAILAWLGRREGDDQFGPAES